MFYLQKFSCSYKLNRTLLGNFKKQKYIYKKYFLKDNKHLTIKQKVSELIAKTLLYQDNL